MLKSMLCCTLRPNEALLSINYFQKDLGDPNPLVRAWALRTMAGIRLHVIAPIVLVAVGKCARDPSVYVRKCAANALPKLHDLRLEENTVTIEEIVGILLNDHSPSVVGAAAAAFASVCPNNLPLVGRNFQRLCEILPDVEEWGQIILIGVLLRYVIAKHGLVKESVLFFLHHSENCKSENGSLESEMKFPLAEDSNYESELAHMVSQCYIEGPEEYLSRSSFMNKDFSEISSQCVTSVRSNEDVKLLLQCTSPLLWSHNSAVLLAAAGVHWIMGSREDVRRIVKPLLFVLRSSIASKYVVLCNIQVFAKAVPSLFAPYFEDFFVCSSDSYHIKALKLDILASIAIDSSISQIYKEFQDYIRDPDRRFAADTIAAIGICVQRLPQMAHTCLEGLLALTRQEIFASDLGSFDGEANVLVQAIMSIKSIIRDDPLRHEKVIIQLVRSLDTMKVPAARAIIIWMVGEYSSLGELVPRMLTTVLKYLAWCFPSEALESKLQILNTTVKVLLCASGEDIMTFEKVLSYLLELAKCDLNYDVRDRACFLKKLLSSYVDHQGVDAEPGCLYKNRDLSCLLAKSLFAGQTKSALPQPNNHRIYLPGSLSQIVLHAAPGYEPLPKPCSLTIDVHETNESGNQATSDPSVTDDLSVSGSLDEETASDYSSQHSSTGSNGGRESDETGSASENGENTDPLIQFSDAGNAYKAQNHASQSGSADFEELMSKRDLESWLDEQPGLSNVNTNEPSPRNGSSARISIGDIRGKIKRKSYVLLDPVNGNGLKVDYSFSSETSSISTILVCIEVFFKNCSTEPMSSITLVDEESGNALDSADQASTASDSSMPSQDEVPTLVPMEGVTSLEPDQTVRRILQVRFHHHLLPLKLALHCNGTRHPVKLWPDIGYFIKAVPLDVDTFINKESHLKGMFEYTRSCTFSDHIGGLNNDKIDGSVVTDKFLEICRSLASKMLSNANIFLVSVDMPIAANLDDASGLCLRFSSEILSTLKPCLITITVNGKCTEPLNIFIKVNCEETVFGLNLLNRVVNFLVEPSHTNL
ncbi:AP3-complex subunit beta-A isoform X2 [Humulus lupulus]|uniref:AP3-complex subunit beta-A isoform X2 n=1 Tax=Humulus lupulus TaxID=3486 RepID=UPI002B405A2E|nr:AP3-complex subunit beta-A isoform X2 [Humulus lupulus]